MKKWALLFSLFVGLCLAGAIGWVRLAPSDPARWHRMPDVVTVGDLPNGAVRVVLAGREDLVRIDAIIRGTPRTRVLAGSVREGMITYVTRTDGIGFPDYTTIRLTESGLELWGRARFGISDLGLNADRLDRWLDALR